MAISAHITNSLLLSESDLSQMSIHDLWCLEELYEQLSWTTMSMNNQPRLVAESACSDHTHALWDKGFNGPRDRIINEIERRTPGDREEIERRAGVLIKRATSGGDFARVIALGAEALLAIEAMEKTEMGRREAA